jgi:fructosamine-3-kinase
MEGLAKLKLWTDNLDGVNLDNDILVKTQWNITTEAWKDTRNLSLVWSGHKLKSKLDPSHERKLQEVSKEANKILKPINEKLNTLSAF